MTQAELRQEIYVVQGIHADTSSEDAGFGGLGGNLQSYFAVSLNDQEVGLK